MRMGMEMESKAIELYEWTRIMGSSFLAYRHSRGESATGNSHLHLFWHFGRCCAKIPHLC